MPDLPPVEQVWDANVGPYVDALAAAIAMAEELAQANADAAASMLALKGSAEDATRAVAGLQAAITALHGKNVSIGVDVGAAAAAAAAATDGLAASLANEATAAQVADDVNAGLAHAWMETAQAGALLNAMNDGMASMYLGQAAAAAQAADSNNGAALAAFAASRALAAQKASVAGVATGMGFFTTALGAAHLIIGAFGANIAADAIGITAFGIAATAAIGPVVSALGTLTTSYGTLDNYQKAAALSLKSLTDAFSPNEAQIFTVFNQGLDMIKSHINAAGGVTSQATIAFMDFFAMLKTQFATTGWVDLFSKSTGVIRTDMDALFGLFNNFLGLIPGIFHDFNGLGLGLIGLANGALRATGAVLNFNPALTKLAGGAALVATAWHLASKWVAFIPSMSETLGLAGVKAADLGAAASLAASEGIVPALSALTGFGEAAVAAAGGIGIAAAGVTALVLWTDRYQSQAYTLAGALAAQDHAVGTNVAGYQKLASQLGQVVSHGQQYIGASRQLAAQSMTLSAAQQQASGTARALSGNFTYLSNTLGLTHAQAIAVANATGVNLKNSLTGSSQAASQARDKMATYAATMGTAATVEKQFAYDMQQANNTTLNMAARLQGLSTAFSVLSGPTLQAMGAAAQFKQSLQGLQQAAHAANDVVGTSTQKQAALTAALAVSTSAAMRDSTAILNQTHSASAAAGPLIAMKDEILDLGLKGQAAAGLISQLQAEINALRGPASAAAAVVNGLNAAINALHSKSITIRTTMITDMFTYHSTIGPSGHARGGIVAGPDYGNDTQLVPMRGGEGVLTPQALRTLGTGNLASLNAGGGSTATQGRSGQSGSDGQAMSGTLEGVNHIHVYLDGRQIWENQQGYTLRYNARNGNPGAGTVAPRNTPPGTRP